MTPQEAAFRLREWYEAFKNFGKGNELTVKEFLEAADVIESMAADLDTLRQFTKELSARNEELHKEKTTLALRMKQLEAENTRRHEKIIQLYNDLENLRDIIATIITDSKETYKQLEAERDAAVADIRLASTSYVGSCQTCKHCKNQVNCDEPEACGLCKVEDCPCRTCGKEDRNWEWRGVQKEG